MGDNPQEPFGRGTIEGTFCTDIDYAIDNDESVKVHADNSDVYEVDSYNLEIKREQGATISSHNGHPVVEILYELTIPVRIDARVGDDVFVDGYEAIWMFTDIESVESVPDETVIVTDHISRSFGVTGDPYE